MHNVLSAYDLVPNFHFIFPTQALEALASNGYHDYAAAILLLDFPGRNFTLISVKVAPQSSNIQ